MTATETTPAGVTLQDWNDVTSKRQAIFDNVKSSLESQFPREYGGVRMELHNSRYEGPEDYDIAAQKEALLDNKFLHRKLKGTVRLFDANTGQQLDEKDMTLMRVPFLTDRNTFIHNGSEYSILNQARLQPGAYTRRKSSGELETHFNTKRGTGPSFRVRLEPETGLFRMDIGQSSLRLYSLLHDLGVSDEHLEKLWGPELLEKNREAYDSRVFEKAYTRLVRRPDTNLDREQKAKAIRDALVTTKLDRRVLERTLPNLFTSKQAFSDNPIAGTSQQAQMKVLRNIPQMNRTDMLGARTFNQDTTTMGGDHEEFHRDDYLMLAYLLNQKFNAHVPMDLPASQLVEAIMRAMKEIMPDFSKEMLAELIKKEASASLGCLMATLSAAEAAPILTWSKEHFNEDELTHEGIEQMPHVTVKYGFKAGVSPATLGKVIKDFGPVRFTLGKITRFKGAWDGLADAIIVEVDSPDIVRLNKLVCEKLKDRIDNGKVIRPFKPHLTLAYVQPGTHKKLDGHAYFSGKTYALTKMMFKTAGGKQREDVQLMPEKD